MNKTYIEEYIPTNGINTYLIRWPADKDKPLLLYLHGGPGETVAPLCHRLAVLLAGECAIATYDQRGTGRTCLKNPDAAVSTELMLEDLRQVIGYLHETLGIKNIALLGHSWGSVLGSLYALRRPEDIICYIGVGQVVSMMENEEEGMRVLRRRIDEAGEKKDQKALLSILPYPDNPRVMMQKMPRVRKLQRKYGLAMKLDAKLVLPYITAPTFRFSDLLAFQKGIASSAALDGELAFFDLRRCPSHYDVPVYYVLGEEDFQTPYELGARYLEAVDAPDKALFPVPDAGHAVPLDNPAGFAQAVGDVLNRLRAPH